MVKQIKSWIVIILHITRSSTQVKYRGAFRPRLSSKSLDASFAGPVKMHDEVNNVRHGKYLQSCSWFVGCSQLLALLHTMELVYVYISGRCLH